jgi:hypothetical protein
MIGWRKRPRFSPRTSASRAKWPRSISPWAIRRPLRTDMTRRLPSGPTTGHRFSPCGGLRPVGSGSGCRKTY